MGFVLFLLLRVKFLLGFVVKAFDGVVRVCNFFENGQYEGKKQLR